jgi:hypothetical protein
VETNDAHTAQTIIYHAPIVMNQDNQEADINENPTKHTSNGSCHGIETLATTGIPKATRFEAYQSTERRIGTIQDQDYGPG